MPTLIGRFNDLLHQLSSSSSSSTWNATPATVVVAPPTHQHHHHHHWSTNNNNNCPHNERPANAVKRSSSLNTHRTKSNQSKAQQLQHTSGRRVEHNGAHAGQRTRQRVAPINLKTQHQSQTQQQQQQHRSHSSRPRSRDPPPVPSIPANPSSSSRRHSSSRRRHSVASVTSPNIIPKNVNKHCKDPISVNKTRDNKETASFKPMDTNKIIDNLISTSNHGNHNNNKNTNNKLATVSHGKAATAKVTNKANHTNTTINNNPTVMSETKTPASLSNEIEQSLATRLARKMKITRKGSNCGTKDSKSSVDFRKHFKFNKKNKNQDSKAEEEDETKGCFISQYLRGYLTKDQPDIISGKTCYDLPIKDVQCLCPRVISSYTGPRGGLVNVHTAPPKPFDLADDVDYIDEDYPDSSLSSAGVDLSPHTSKSSSSNVSSDGRHTSSEGTGSPNSGYTNNKREPVAGVLDWNASTDYAFGVSNSLYESHPTTKKNAGDPIADSFAVCVRENSAILTLADGVNWGEGACLASRCAIYGCMDYLNNALYSPAESTRVKNTLVSRKPLISLCEHFFALKDIFVALLRSFNAAHNLILAQGGQLTTLCAAIVCQLKNSERFVVCTCNVGDSLAYVYSPRHGIREITQESHDIFSMRDMRDALGALGPVSGCEPELNNLTVAMTIVDAGDIVFLTSDGISDNFDPVVGKFAMPRKELPDPPREEAAGEHSSKKGDAAGECGDTTDHAKTRKKVQRSNSNPERGKYRSNFTSKGLPLVSAQQRHALTLLRMEDLIANGVGGGDALDGHTKLTARGLCLLMMEFTTKLTMAKRHILEDPELYPEDDEDGVGSEAFVKQRNRRRQVGGKLMQMPGKLDHATIAAVEIGFYGTLANASKEKNNNSTTYTSGAHLFNSRKDYPRGDARYDLRMKATLARFESQDSLDLCTESALI